MFFWVFCRVTRSGSCATRDDAVMESEGNIRRWKQADPTGTTLRAINYSNIYDYDYIGLIAIIIDVIFY
jgi:hypothetical protein